MEAYLMYSLPDFLIIGVGKGGTTSLYENLTMHPKIQKLLGDIHDPADRYNSKEIGFFTHRYDRGVKWYMAQFPEREPGCLLFEATPSYISRPPEVQERIRALLPGVKAIVLLRNPTERAWSEYAPTLAHLPYSHTLDQLMSPDYRVVRRGVYVDQIKRWHGLFHRDSLLILRSEDYFADPHAALRKVYDFLRVEEVFPDEISRHDPWKRRKDKYGYPAMPDDVRAWLDEFYAPHNKRLEEYLGRDFGWGAS